jgi:hypothetical protein
MALVEITDFTGRFLLAKNSYSVADIQSYIDEFVASSLANLLGAELAADFMLDLNGSGVPVSPQFLALYNPFNIDIDDCGEVLTSRGIKHYLIGIVYWWYMVESRVQPNATGGSGQPKPEVSSAGYRPAAEHYQRYNTSIDTGRAIQTYIENNPDVYPSYNGQRLLYNAAI